MSIIKYKVNFKRILTAQVREPGGKIGTIRVGELQHFQQNLDGTLDIVAWIWPQVTEKMRDIIEKNPGILGMTAETQPVTDHMIFPDGTKFDEIDAECEHEFVSTFKMNGEANPDRTCLKCGRHT